MFAAGDLTEIGEKGVNLSGGQKALFGNLWLAHWAERNDKSNAGDDTVSAYFLAVYGALAAGSATTMAASMLVLWLRCSYSASQHTHQKLVRGIIRSPVSFFDTTPVGRILGLFGSDQTLVDEGVPAAAEAGLKAVSQALVSLVLITMAMPAMLVVLIPLGFVYANLQSRFIPIARHARGSVNTARNIGISSIDEALDGAATIRAYKRQESFERAFSTCTESYARAWWTFLCPNRWLATRLDLLSAAIVCTAALLQVTMQYVFNGASSSYAGLSLTYALAIVGVLNTCLRSTMMVELSLISVERIRQYSLVKPEAESAVAGCRPTELWPEHGALEFVRYSARYRQDADLVLKDLSFRIEARNKVGIVGRTGAGKSSLTLALFRIIEAASGKILIDGRDTAQYGLQDIRSRLSIIPQDPLMFAATVRENLDPLGDYTDQQIWSALERVRLAEPVRSKGEGLEYGVAQGGANFSVGQRQLFCIARALLKRTRILILDEATAAIDSSTDAVVQETIRREFGECTVLTIAHRLDTIIDSDKVLVIDNGSVAEYDAPETLLADWSSMFSLLVAEARAGATAA
ncbi:hypothetical protein GGI15_004355 [Coemansia interrupta]|uniref:Uncharacterized protein n=1 Tax=Coemansia interrupta TaxID=1126814 RepID=A0A9W8HAW1_9FUNG|nr:hypothetical protein GGI15_004355 [Coemansia interrupta]